MPVSCSAYGCTNRCHSKTVLSFFRFPFSNPDLLKLWMNAIRRKDFVPTIYSRICSDHFEESDVLILQGFKKKHLKPGAVPSKFPSFPQHMQPNPKKPRLSNRNMKESNNVTFKAFETVQEDQPISLCIDQEVQTDETGLPCTVNDLKQKIKMLNQRVMRQKIRITNLKGLVTTLRKKSVTKANVEAFLSNRFDGNILLIICKNHRFL